MTELAQVAKILNRYPIRGIRKVERLGGAGGFSGAKFWRVEATDINSEVELCLRRWPREHPTSERLAWLHAVLCHAAGNGFTRLPVPLRNNAGETFLTFDGHLWELTRWLAGTADFHSAPSRARLHAAMRSLAQFHKATRSYSTSTAIAPGISSRLKQSQTLDDRKLNEMSQAVAVSSWPQFKQQAVSILHLFGEHKSRLEQLLLAASQLQVTVQPCIRDIWHDHVLFDGNEVSGFVDFGAMRLDHLGCDISRLLGSLVQDEQEGWQLGLEAYQSVQPLSSEDLQLITAFDRSNVLLSGMNWVQWVAVERRQFEHPARIVGRLAGIVERLQCM